MDDDIKQLEAELARLRPATPSRALIKRVEAELATVSAPPSLPWIEWILAAALPAAALIALLLTLIPRTGETSAKQELKSHSPGRVAGVASLEAPLKPIAAEKVLVSADDEGLVTLADGTPARRERLQYVDTITWKNPRTNASLRWTVPREEIRVVPISFQ